MKRNLILTFLFLFMAAAIFLTSCTCNPGSDYACRGCGYEARYFCAGVNESCQNGGSATTMIIGEPGVDYQLPVIEVIPHGNSAELRLTMELISNHTWKFNAEICFLQDGMQIGQYDLSTAIQGPTTFEVDKMIQLDLYNENGGEVYYILNSHALVRSGD